MPHSTSIHVYPTDCDMLGHVNHATMITFLEHARWALLERQLLGAEPAGNVWEAFSRQGIFTVVRHVDIAYQAQVLPGDDIEIRSGLLSVGRTSFVIRQDVRKARDGRVAAEAKLTFVCVGTDGRPVAVPERWRTVFPLWDDSEAAAADAAT